MDLAALAMFRAVARAQSVTRAAAQLGRVPSNVTTRIQQLEEELGVPLFLRERKRMIPTEAGRLYLDYAERILNLAEEAAQRVNPAGPAGVLRIGSMECTVASRLPAPLARFNAQWPQVRLELSTAPSRQLLDALLAHRIDCALVAIPPGESGAGIKGCDRLAVFREELVLLLPAGHGAVGSVADLGRKALAGFAPGCTYRLLAEDWLASLGASPGRFPVQEVRSYHAMFACTAAGSCFSVMPRSVLEMMGQADMVEARPLLAIDTHLVWRPGFSTPAFEAFREALKSFANIAATAR